MTAAHDDVVEGMRIRSVLERYCSFVDAGAVDELLELFSDDCTLATMGRTLRGKPEIASLWAAVAPVSRPTTLHALVNPVVSIDGNSATAISGWAMIDRSGAGGGARIALAGHYHDTLTRDGDGRWKFTSRRVETIARGPAEAP